MADCGMVAGVDEDLGAIGRKDDLISFLGALEVR
jgi:hypothetical protein